MHYPEYKSAAVFQSEVDALIAGTSTRSTAGIIDFSRFHFPRGISLSRKVFSRYACFLGVVFGGPVDFSGSRFQDANFVGVTFPDVDFTATTFSGIGDFGGAAFTQRAIFTRGTFEKEASFRDSRFGAEVDFADAELRSPVFAGSAFGGRAWFGAARLFGANFQTASFGGEAAFLSAKFFGSVDFGYTRHVGESSFVDAVLEDANFSCAKFSRSLNFYRAVFHGPALFHLAKFHDVRFESAQFGDGADFEAATFSGDAEFQYASFGPPSSDRAPVADFTSARFEKPARVWFTQVNRSAGGGLRARFLNCDVEQIHLEDVHWYRRGRRMILQDELDVVERSKPTEPDMPSKRRRAGHELVAITYRQLINNFDRVRALDLAEDCFCGSMEMKRRDPNESPVSRMVLTAYKWGSSYGSSYAQALLVLLCIVAVFGLLFAAPLIGLDTTARKDGAIQMASTWLRRCPAGLFHSLEVATFQRETTYSFSLRRGRLAAMAEQIFIPVQVALLLLALRRRFRR